MASWIEEKAEQLKQREEAVQKERDWQIHATQVLRARGREILEELEKSVREDVAKWNQKFSADHTKQIEGVAKNFPSGFKVNKTYYPSFGLYVSFDAESCSVSYEFAKNSGMDFGSYDGHGAFRIRLAEDGNVYLLHSGKPVSFPEASQILLQPLLEFP
jgi:hypothetical protein